MGWDSDTSTTKLTKCEGDCDTNADCDGTLQCFHRAHNDPNPPGCSGTPVGSQDYCIEQDNTVVSFTLIPNTVPHSTYFKFIKHIESISYAINNDENVVFHYLFLSVIVCR